MKNVLLIGDSIRIGYQERVRELLGPDVTVFAPKENCGFTKQALWGLFGYMGQFGMPHIDVAQFNTGSWDLHRCTRDGNRFTDIDEYAYTIRRLGHELQYYCDKVIFATTTPCGKQFDELASANPEPLLHVTERFWETFLGAPAAIWNADVIAYNARAVAEMDKLGIEVNDFYTPIMEDTDRYISKDGDHLTPEGYELLAQLTVKKIKPLL